MVIAVLPVQQLNPVTQGAFAVVLIDAHGLLWGSVLALPERGQGSQPCSLTSPARARINIVETASRFARDLMVQKVGFAKLQALGIKLVAADSRHSFLDDTPTSKLIR